MGTSYSKAMEVIIRPPARTVVIAMDGSYHSEYAFQWYNEHFRRSDDEVIVVHCSERNQAFHAALGTADIQSICSMLSEEEEAEENLRMHLEKKLKSHGIRGSVKTSHGKPGEVIINVAKEVDASNIIVGTRGLGTLRRTFMGSVSDYVVHHSEVPVTVCRQKQNA